MIKIASAIILKKVDVKILIFFKENPYKFCKYSDLKYIMNIQ